MIKHWLLEILNGWLNNHLSNVGFILYLDSKGDAPDAPDFAAAAKAQGVANLESARATAKLNNPNIINPYGTQTVKYGGDPVFDAQGYDTALKQYQKDLSSYDVNKNNNNYNGVSSNPFMSNFPTRDNTPAPVAPDRNSFYKVTGDPDIGTVTQTLSPAEQNIYNKNVQQRTNVGDVGIQGSAALKDIIGKKIDFSGAPLLGAGRKTRDQVYSALMGRVNEDTANQRSERNSQLIAAGIRPGNKAYNDAQNLISRQYNDARGVAEINAGNAATQQFGMDSQARQQYISELLAQRQTPLNEINALMSGSQVNNPFAGNLGYQGGSSVQAAPIYAGAQAQGQSDLNAYNAQQAGGNGFMSGLFGLGAAGLGAPTGTFKGF